MRDSELSEPTQRRSPGELGFACSSGSLRAEAEFCFGGRGPQHSVETPWGNRTT